jgi:hypothetical protein
MSSACFFLIELTCLNLIIKKSAKSKSKASTTSSIASKVNRPEMAKSGKNATAINSGKDIFNSPTNIRGINSYLRVSEGKKKQAKGMLMFKLNNVIEIYENEHGAKKNIPNI